MSELDASAGSPGHPPHWEADVVLADGGTVHIRPITPDDADGIRGLHARMSERTRYFRYFSVYSVMPERDVHRFTHVDHDARVALVAVLGDDIVAVARYDRIAPGEAEVAFVVEDAHQGRGLGSVLLEHIAAAARERGIRRFVAEVLPDNRRMVRVFLDAGYEATRSYEEGVVHLTFPIEPTAHSVEVMQAREQRAEARSIERLLTPRSVAVVGASTDPASVGHVVFANLLGAGLQGPVYPVHPTAAHVGGVRAYASVLDVPDEVDVAVVAVPASAVEGVVEQCAQKAVRGLVVVSAGFGETGPDGRAAEHRLVRTARAHGMRVVGPNCLGVVNTDPAVRLNATLAPVTPSRGRVGFFSQSGALGIALLASAAQRGLGLSSFVSAGNRADVSGNDMLQYWESDPATDVVLLHLESFGNPRKFVRLARRLARHKPVAAVKSSGARPGLAGVPLSEEQLGALFEQAGVVRVDTLAQLFDVATLFAYQPLPAGRTVAVVGNSTSLALLAADACDAAGLEVAGGAPLDVGATASPEEFRTALGAALDDPAVHAAVVVFLPPLATTGEDYAAVISAEGQRSGKPLATTFLAVEGVPAALRRLTADGVPGPGSVPSYPSPERAVLALGRVAAYVDWRRQPVGTTPALSGVDGDAARTLVGSVLAKVPDGRPLDETEAAGLLAAYGVPVWPSLRASTPEEAAAAAAELGHPVVVKSADPALQHRVDLGGVRLGLRDAEDVRAAAESLGGAVVVQSMAPPGVPVLVGVAESASFGALVSFGVAGVATDLLGDTAYRILPLTDVDAARLVRSVRAAPLLFGHRGAAPADVEALEDLLLRVGRLADDLPEVGELELNPVLVGERGVAVLGAAVRVAPPPARPDAGPRRLRPG